MLNNPGRYNRQVAIQIQPDVQDSYGQPVENWVDWKTVWAKIRPIRGREYYQAHQVSAEVTTELYMPFTKGITPVMRIKHCNRYFEILGVIDIDDMHQETMLMCKEVV